MATLKIIAGTVYGNAQHVAEQVEENLAEQGVDCSLESDPSVADFTESRQELKNLNDGLDHVLSQLRSFNSNAGTWDGQSGSEIANCDPEILVSYSVVRPVKNAYNNSFKKIEKL